MEGLISPEVIALASLMNAAGRSITKAGGGQTDIADLTAQNITNIQNARLLAGLLGQGPGATLGSVLAPTGTDKPTGAPITPTERTSFIPVSEGGPSRLNLTLGGRQMSPLQAAFLTRYMGGSGSNFR